MSHLGSYKWIRKTQIIPRFGGVLQGSGDLLGVYLEVDPKSRTVFLMS